MATAPQRDRQAAAFRDGAKAADRGKAESEAPWGGSHLFEREMFPFSEVHSATFMDGLGATLAAGNAITLSLTRDGGAVKVSLWVKGVKHVAYAASSDQLDIIMASLLPATTDAAKGQ